MREDATRRNVGLIEVFGSIQEMDKGRPVGYDEIMNGEIKVEVIFLRVSAIYIPV